MEANPEDDARSGTYRGSAHELEISLTPERMHTNRASFKFLSQVGVCVVAYTPTGKRYFSTT